MIPHISQTSPSTMSFKLFLFIHEIENLPVEMTGGDCSKSSLMVRIEWGGSGRKVGFLHRGLKKSWTSKQPTQADGTVIWNEGFNCICKLKRRNSQSYKSWIVNLEVQEFDKNLNSKSGVVIGKTKIDVAEYAPTNKKKRIRIPIKCNIKDQTTETILKVKLRFVELSTKALALPRSLSFHAFSCVGVQQNYSTEFSSHPSIYPWLAYSSSEDEAELNYGEIATTNMLLGAAGLPGKPEDFEDYDEKVEEQNVQRVRRQASLVRLLSNKTKLSFKAIKHPRGEPLLNKSCSDVGGDDIDIERHQQSSPEQQQPDDRPDPQNGGGFEDGVFEVGLWEKRRFVSRDGEMELVADIFLASIDQRSETAAGGSACTVLAVVIADWLHNNPKVLPLRCQLDELIRQGSMEWRKLCADESHKDKFSDHHFDLDTVLEARVRALTEMKTRSYVGFFSLDDMPDGLRFLQETMSFDGIWDELFPTSASKEEEGEERIYIASWNDHFFVVKTEGDAIYLIDTFGERLFEGCNQAYILRFDKQSVIYKLSGGPDLGAEDSNECKQDGNCCEEVMCEGVVCCKDYIKGFLAALPLRELQEDVRRGAIMEEAVLHRRLQIEFHHTAPSIN